MFFLIAIKAFRGQTTSKFHEICHGRMLSYPSHLMLMWGDLILLTLQSGSSTPSMDGGGKGVSHNDSVPKNDVCIDWFVLVWFFKHTDK
jgi:hypothetical protein